MPQSSHQTLLSPSDAPPPPSVSGTAPDVPLCVDLDSTIVRTNLLFESALLLIKQRLSHLFLIPVWWLRGRAKLSAELSARVEPNVATLPYDDALIRWIQAERSAGRPVWLCASFNGRLAARVAAHLGIFDGVLYCDGQRGAADRAVSAKLVERFGERGFDYCGNERSSVDVWKHCRAVVLVDDSPPLERHAEGHMRLLGAFQRRERTLRAIARTIRPHQWAKNVLVLVPLLAAHRADDLAAAADAALATVAFCLCASSVYIVNDLLDLEADRAHARKSKRPLASGELSPIVAAGLAVVLFATAVFLSSGLTIQFFATLAAYYVLTLAYSLVLKGIAVFDVIVLATLYTIRVFAGALVTDSPLSLWLLLFSVFLFLSLAFIKRFAELEALRRTQSLSVAAGRGYSTEDLPLLQTLGSAAGYLSVLVLALYINSPHVEALYDRPVWLWLLCVLALHWISYLWIKTQRGEMHDDPLVFALTDRTSLTVGVLAAFIVLLAA